MNFLKSGVALVVLAWSASTGLWAQLCTVNGVIEDALTGEALIGAYVKSGNAVVATDFDGRFSMPVPKGEATLEVSYIGYDSQTKTVKCDGSATSVKFRMETLIMKEAVVSADVVISRKTPVAFTNVLPAQIQEELAGRDLPLVLNTTPGVYATQQGGGDGDARVTIRGFDQTNLAVMVDGVPMNDMENGWVYWSNWAGLDLVVRTTQVQRGLGASKLAIPSVGGTINILTGGDESANGALTYQSEVGTYGYFRNSLSGVFGSREKGFLHMVGSFKTNRGFGEGLESKAYAYYLKGRKTIGNHNLSFTAFGAPQRHGQRSWKMQVFEYDTAYAQSLTNDAGLESLNGIIDGFRADSTAIVNRGRGFNEHIVNYQEVYYDFNAETGQIDTTYGAARSNDPNDGMRRYNSRQNFYFKPIVTVRDVWSISDRSTLTTTAYASFGRGGGESLRDTPSSERMADGTIDLQRIWDGHQLFEFGPNGLNVDSIGRKSSNFIQTRHNDHRWFGALSNFNTQLTEELALSMGVDARHYTGSHYATIGDLLGGTYYNAPAEDRNQNLPFDTPMGEGDKFLYHDDGQVAWGGTYLQLEADKLNYSAFVNVSGAQSWYRAIDYFRPQVVTLEGTTYEVRSNDEFQELGETNKWRRDTTFLTANHPGLQTYTTDWERLNSATIKAGGSYNINEWTSAYTNLGYLSRAPLFNSVFDRDNNLIEGYENQYVKAVELGVKYVKGNFASNINAYRTAWENKAVNRTYAMGGLWNVRGLSVYCDTSTVEGINNLIDLVDGTGSAAQWDDAQFRSEVLENADRSLGFTLLNADAIHSGIEWDFAYDPAPKWNVQGVFSAGNWRWTSNERVDLVDINNNTLITRTSDNSVADTLVNLDGVKVGDAAQRQVSFAVSYRPKRGTYLSLRNTWFWQHYSNFSPGDVITGGEPDDVWITPAYSLLDINAGTSFDVSDKAKLRARLSVTNALNALCISDAVNDDDFAYSKYGEEGTSGHASVFLGPPTMVRLSLVLEMRGLQNRNTTP